MQRLDSLQAESGQNQPRGKHKSVTKKRENVERERERDRDRQTDRQTDRQRQRENSNSLLYQTPGVYVQGGNSKQFNSSSDISFGKSLSNVYTGGREQQSKGQCQKRKKKHTHTHREKKTPKSNTPTPTYARKRARARTHTHTHTCTHTRTHTHAHAINSFSFNFVLTVSKAVHKCRSAWQFMLICSSLQLQAWKM